jgi:hypothetical protein
MKKLLVVAFVLLSWFVVTYSGQTVAGPFGDYNDCQNTAKYMHDRYTNVSEFCQIR